MQINNSPSSNILTADIGGSHITVAICNINSNIIQKDSMIRVELVRGFFLCGGYGLMADFGEVVLMIPCGLTS